MTVKITVVEIPDTGPDLIARAMVSDGFKPLADADHSLEKILKLREYIAWLLYQRNTGGHS